VFEQQGDNQQAEVQMSYTVKEEAVMLSSKPTYRDYIYVPTVPAEKIHSSMRPETSKEKTLWESSYTTGWHSGYNQANGMYFDGLMELHQDIIGRSVYLIMIDLNMIEPIEIVRQNNGIVGVNRTLNVGETIYSLESVPNFKDASGWQTAWKVSKEFHDLQLRGWQEGI
jgi:hypothetical protein